MNRWLSVYSQHISPQTSCSSSVFHSLYKIILETVSFNPSLLLLSLQPSHGDKAANPKVLKWMTDLTKIRRQIKGTTATCFSRAFVCVCVSGLECLCSMLDSLTPSHSQPLTFVRTLHACWSNTHMHAHAGGVEVAPTLQCAGASL